MFCLAKKIFKWAFSAQGLWLKNTQLIQVTGTKTVSLLFKEKKKSSYLDEMVSRLQAISAPWTEPNAAEFTTFSLLHVASHCGKKDSLLVS